MRFEASKKLCLGGFLLNSARSGVYLCGFDLNFKEELMRVLATCIVALGLVVSPVLAGTTAPGTNDSAAANTTATTAAQPAAAPVPAATADPAAKPEPSSSEVAAELQQLRDLLEAQSKQLQEQQQKMQLLEDQLNASSAARENLAIVPGVADGAGLQPATGVAASANLANTTAGQEKTGPPTSIQFKGITLTPGGFFAAETVWRSKALASDVNTPFNSAPFDAQSNAHMSEFQASGRQSRISMLVEGKLDNVKIGGYYEMDFLSAAATSNNNQSNSYAMRQRQIYAQAAFNSGWTFTGGQMWSLLTETTHGMDNRTEALPAVIDAQYVSGFSWARQYGFRVTKSFNNKFWLGASVEESQATLTVHGNPTATCAPSNTTLAGFTTNGLCSASALNGTRVLAENSTGTGTTTAVILPNVYNNFLVGAFGASGGLYDVLGNYQYNPSPDIIVKAVWEPGFGHYEAGGLFTDFRDRVFPCVTATAAFPVCGTLPTSATTTVPNQFSSAGAYNDNRAGGGAFANARWNLLQKKVDVGVHFLGGSGIGRYGSAGLADVTTRFVPSSGAPALQDGTLAPIRNFQALGTLQLHPTPKLDINFYVGGEYEARAQYQKVVGGAFNEGYGATGLANFGCGAAAEVLPFAAQSTSASTGVPTSVAGANGFIPGAAQNCTGDTRNLIEGTISFWYRFYSGPKGRVQFGMQYSNYVRNTWRGLATGTATGGDGITYSTNGGPHSDENMVFTSFRYYLP
jgi:hypothetical protein